MPNRGYNHRRKFSMTCQKLALEKVYPNYFPSDKYRLIEVDEMPGDLAQTLDIGGIDKIFSDLSNGHLVFLSHRFREKSVWENKQFRDFTIRESEWNRHVEAVRNNGTIPNYYGYGYANGARIQPDRITDFVGFYLLDYRRWLPDVLESKARSPYFKDNNGNQENFYWIKWEMIPWDYIVYFYPTFQLSFN